MLGLTQLHSLLSRFSLDNLLRSHRKFARSYRAAAQRAKSRRVLARLPAELLKDIGVDPQDALHESQKGFWQE